MTEEEKAAASTSPLSSHEYHRCIRLRIQGGIELLLVEQMGKSFYTLVHPVKFHYYTLLKSQKLICAAINLRLATFCPHIPSIMKV